MFIQFLPYYFPLTVFFGDIVLYRYTQPTSLFTVTILRSNLGQQEWLTSIFQMAFSRFGKLKKIEEPDEKLILWNKEKNSMFFGITFETCKTCKDFVQKGMEVDNDWLRKYRERQEWWCSTEADKKEEENRSEMEEKNVTRGKSGRIVDDVGSSVSYCEYIEVSSTEIRPPILLV